jgi:hypothetical protein
MLSKKSSKPELSNPNYVPVFKGSDTYYGGSQMWFAPSRKYRKDSILHNYGCGTIATADFFLYLALQHMGLRSPETEVALRGGYLLFYENYEPYVRVINHQYTKTKPIIAVLGTTIASAINEYSQLYGFGLQASWKFRLTYYDMLDIMEEMLSSDIPVILSIGPNIPNLWGKKGIPFYIKREINLYDDNRESSGVETVPSDDSNIEDSDTADSNTDDSNTADITTSLDTPELAEEPNKVSKNGKEKKPYYYKVAVSDIKSHYVTVTGVIRDDIANQIMLCISSWGRQYYINYEEYWDYVDNIGGTFTSSIVRVQKT